MPVKDDLIKQFREQQLKFVYYLIALCVTSIGFCIHSTKGSTLTLIHIPLAISILLWGISIWSGFRFIKYALSALHDNVHLLNFADGTQPLPHDTPANRTYATSIIKKQIESKGEKTSNFMKWQWQSFFSGIAFFITWHLLEMAQN